jgi:hypothetical protein
MSNIVKLRTAAKSYYTVHKAGRYFDVVLVTPIPGKNIKSRLYRVTEEQYAHDLARKVAASRMRPFKLRGVTV